MAEIRPYLGIFVFLVTLITWFYSFTNTNPIEISNRPRRFLLPLSESLYKQNDMLSKCNSLEKQSTLKVKSINFMVDPVHKVAYCR